MRAVLRCMVSLVAYNYDARLAASRRAIYRHPGQARTPRWCPLRHRRLFSSAGIWRKPGPNGPTQEITSVITEMKLRNPKFGYQCIAEQISQTFDTVIDKDVVHRMLATHYRAGSPGPSGSSWLTLFAQTKDSLWSVDLFRCESILLRSNWALVVIDVFTGRIIGFGIGDEYVDGPTVCRMFSHAIAGHASAARISRDHGRLFRFHRWLANLRTLEVE